MAGGQWVGISHPTPDDIAQSSPLSMVHVRTSGFKDNCPFYPLPYRTPNHSILFPRDVNGYYMRDEVVAAFAWRAALSPDNGRIETPYLWRFIPADDARPFHFLRELFDYRADLVRHAKETGQPDIREKVVKLGINSVYGKLAQRIGGGGHAPAHASPWHAAAITAWTRAQLIHAAISDPTAIVMFATDGIVSTRPLPLEIPPTKTLGTWEAGELPDGGVFVQSGVYALSSDVIASGARQWFAKSRGFRPANIGGDVVGFIRDRVPKLWKSGIDEFPFPYTNYITLGAATASEDLWRFAGTWADGVRTLDLNSAGVKRDVPPSKTVRRSRSQNLIATWPNCANILLCDERGDMMLSAPSEPDWLHERLGVDDDDEQEAIEASFSED
jgi:hypothetical protein